MLAIDSNKRKNKQEAKRFCVREGEDALTPHELLELLLFYSPVCDSRSTAHRLIEHFGSVKRIAETSFDTLSRIEGIDVDSAILMTLILALSRNCVFSDCRVGRTLDCLDDFVALARRFTMGRKDEVFYAIYLDSSMQILDFSLIATGTINEAKPFVRTILEKCIETNAAFVVGLHNHPNGSIEPSDDDLEFTKMLTNALLSVQTELLEHIIVDERSFFAIKAFQRQAGEVYTNAEVRTFVHKGRKYWI